MLCKQEMKPIAKAMKPSSKKAKEGMSEPKAETRGRKPKNVKKAIETKKATRGLVHERESPITVLGIKKPQNQER